MRAITTPQPLARSRLVESDSSPSSFRVIANPFVDIVVPVLNEEKILQSSIETLDEYMMENLPYRYRITIADNGSQDKTLEIANSLAQNHQSVRVVRLAERGRGRALKQVWQSSQADILMYMDVDLSTSLDDFLPMIQPLVAGEAGVAIGGFNGSDTPLTLEQFKQLVAYDKLKYYAASSRGHGGGPNGGNSKITNWIKKNGKVVNYGGGDVTLYELSA